MKIYGTDIDEEALQTARAATYTADETASLPSEMRGRYFEQVGDRYIFRADLRRSVIFGRLDVLNDAPISRLVSHPVSCPICAKASAYALRALWPRNS